MQRTVINVITGEVRVVDLTAQEITEDQASADAYVAFLVNTKDARAARAIDSMDRLQFEHLFDLENRTRILELKPQITRAQYRQFLIDKWKTLNP